MNHRNRQRKLNRTSEHRRALLRNMAQNLIEHGRIKTTLPKAKTLRPYFERVITLAVKSRKLAAASDEAGALRARRRLYRMLGDRSIIPQDHRDAYVSMTDARRAKSLRMVSGRRYRTGEPKGRLAFTAESVTHRLIDTVAPKFEDRRGGYTRLVRLPVRRLGDHSAMAMLELVGDEEAPLSLTKPGRSARRRRADARYAMVVKLSKSLGRKSKTDVDDATPEDETESSAPETEAPEAQPEDAAETGTGGDTPKED
ncbi:MAG: 50S ribosomal protein L17 [Phycisphaerae bacterium]|jgi:large subunit ribosomal protein L17